jgi:hypothetical protein
MLDMKKTMTVAVSALLLFSLLTSLRASERTLAQHHQNNTDYLYHLYRGQWTSEGQTFGPLSENSGRAYFAAQQVGFDNYTTQFVLFDGQWEDDQAFALISRNATLDEDTGLMSLGTDLHLFDFTHRNFIESKDKSELEINGSILFAPSGYLYDVGGILEHNASRLDFDLEQLTEEAIKEGKISYSMLFTAVNLLTFCGFIRHLCLCVESQAYARRTSLVFLGMNCSIDLFLSLWHLRLALTYYNSFDYFILASMWSFAVLAVVQGKLVKVVWKAQNAAIIDFVRVT